MGSHTSRAVMVAVVDHLTSAVTIGGEKVESLDENQGRIVDAGVECQKGIHVFIVYCWHSKGWTKPKEEPVRAMLGRVANTKSHWILACDANMEARDFNFCDGLQEFSHTALGVQAGGSSVPDPIALRAVAGAARPQASLVTAVNHTSFPASLCGASCHTKEQRRPWAMAFPRINCRTTTATVLTATATVTLCFLLSHLPSQVHRRQKQLSNFVKTKKYWTLPKSCGSQSSEREGAQEEQDQERLALYT